MNADQGKSNSLKTWLPSLVGAGGLLFGVTSFLVQYFYLPQHEPRSLEVRSSLEKVGENANFVVIKGTIKIKNITKTRVEMLGGYYNVTGSKIEPAKMSDKEYSESLARQLREKGRTRSARHYWQSKFETVFGSRVFDDTTWFDAEQEYEHEFHVYVPRNRYDLVQLQVVMDYAKNRKLVSAIWKVDKYGEIQAMACRKLPDFQKDQTNCEELDPDSPQYDEFARKYGIAQTDSLSELNLLRMRTPTFPLHKK